MVTWYGELLLFLSACVHATHAMGTIRPNTSRQVASFKGNDRFGPNVNLILLNRLYDFSREIFRVNRCQVLLLLDLGL